MICAVASSLWSYASTRFDSMESNPYKPSNALRSDVDGTLLGLGGNIMMQRMA
jgi:hypothetical protein